MRSKSFRWILIHETDRSSIAIVSRSQDGEIEAYLGVRVATLGRCFTLCDHCAARSANSLTKNGEFFAKDVMFSTSFGEFFANDGLIVKTHGEFSTQCGLPFVNDCRFPVYSDTMSEFFSSGALVW